MLRPLIEAVKHGGYACVHALVERGRARLHLTDSRGKDAMAYAQMAGEPAWAIVGLLSGRRKRSSIDPHALDRTGPPPVFRYTNEHSPPPYAPALSEPYVAHDWKANLRGKPRSRKDKDRARFQDAAGGGGAEEAADAQGSSARGGAPRTSRSCRGSMGGSASPSRSRSGAGARRVPKAAHRGKT